MQLIDRLCQHARCIASGRGQVAGSLTMLLALAAPGRAVAAPEETAIAVRPVDVAALARIIDSGARGLGTPCRDRAPWRALAREPAFRDAMAAAERELGKPTPAVTDEQFLAFSRTGNRTDFEAGYFLRTRRLTWFTEAECLEGRGRFVPAIERELDAILSERTWVMSAHDGDLVGFHGAVKMDLGAAMRSWTVATTDHLLADWLSAGTRARIRREVRRRAIDPFLALTRSGRSAVPHLVTELTYQNNHSIVVLSGLVSATLALADSRDDRATALAAASAYSRYFLSGYTEDGYCSEGLGYWNYGFGHYALLAEAVRQATHGQVDWWRVPKVQTMARFGQRIEISDGAYPAFADSNPDEVPERWLMDLVSRKLSLRLGAWEQQGWVTSGKNSIYYVAAVVFGDRSPVRALPSRPASSALRDVFPLGGAYVLRPGPGGPPGFGVAFKGGHNDEWHNHNDIGSYVVASGGKAVLVDPGLEVYTARTFSERRYDSSILNSYGHPVPVVAGSLQQPGRARRAVQLGAEFGAAVDVVRLDLKAAYDVPSLRSLRRTFRYDRIAGGALTISDSVRFSSPQTFGTALVTFGSWHQVAPDVLLVTSDGTTVKVTISSDGGPVAIVPERLAGDLPRGRIPLRLGVNLAEPVTAATITVRVEPVSSQP